MDANEKKLPLQKRLKFYDKFKYNIAHNVNFSQSILNQYKNKDDKQLDIIVNISILFT